jgi:hypothetical protein
MNTDNKLPSPTRTYVILLEVNDFKNFRFKKFFLPEEYENTCANATWYFYNCLDGFSCGFSAFAFEDYSNIVDCSL